MTAKDIAVVDTDTALAPSPADGGRRSPARVTPGADLDVGGSNVGTVDTDEFALDFDDSDGGRELVERDVVADPSYPRVKGHQWVERDKPILDSFVATADEIGLTAKQREKLAAWFVGPAQTAAGAATDVDDYTFDAEDEIETSALGRAMSGKFKEFALQAGLNVETANATVDFFLSESHAQIATWDAEHRAESSQELRAEWGSDCPENIRIAQAYLNGLGEVGRTLKQARTRDGKRLIHAPGFPQWLHEAAMREKDPDPDTKPSSALSDTTALRKEASAIRALREKDRELYHREWRSSGSTASDRLLEIERELEAKAKGTPTTSAAAKARDLAEEKRELLKLEKTDEAVFLDGRWRGTKLSPAERLHQIATRGR